MNVAVPAFIFARVLFHMQYAHVSYSPPFQFSTFTARNNVKFIWLMQCGPICVSCAMVWPSTWHMKYTYAENISGHDILCSDKKLLSFAHFTFDHQGLL